MPRYKASVTIEFDVEFESDSIEDAEELLEGDEFLEDIIDDGPEHWDELFYYYHDLEELS